MKKQSWQNKLLQEAINNSSKKSSNNRFPVGSEERHPREGSWLLDGLAAFGASLGTWNICAASWIFLVTVMRLTAAHCAGRHFLVIGHGAISARMPLGAVRCGPTRRGRFGRNDPETHYSLCRGSVRFQCTLTGCIRNTLVLISMLSDRR